MVVGAYMMYWTHRLYLQAQHKQMDVSIEYSRVTSQIEDMQARQARMSNSFSLMMGNFSTMNEVGYNTSLMFTQAKVNKLAGQVRQASTDEQRSIFRRQLQDAQADARRFTRGLHIGYEMAERQIAFAKTMHEKMEHLANKAKMDQLKMKKEELDHELVSAKQKTIEYKAQYDEYKKLAEDEAKDAAPKFGLS